jgi:hypothetical protein
VKKTTKQTGVNKMKKSLEIGTNYAGIFNLPANCKMIYNGANSWTGVKPDGSEKTMESQKQTDAALEYLNRQNYSVAP